MSDVVICSRLIEFFFCNFFPLFCLNNLQKGTLLCFNHVNPIFFFVALNCTNNWSVVVLPLDQIKLVIDYLLNFHLSNMLYSKEILKTIIKILFKTLVISVSNSSFSIHLNLQVVIAVLYFLETWNAVYCLLHRFDLNIGKMVKLLMIHVYCRKHLSTIL